jgi:hypothetical protein
MNPKLIKWKLSILFSLIFFGLFGLAKASLAANYYVDKDSIGGTCSDAYTLGQNDITHPWCTIQRGTSGSTDYTLTPSTAIAAGDTLYIRAGTYAVTGRGGRHLPALQPANAGTAENNRIIIQNYPGEAVTITYAGSPTCDGAGSGPLIGSYMKNYITWRGASNTNLLRIVEITGGWHSDTGPVVAFDCDYTTFDNLEVVGASQTSCSTDNHVGIDTRAADTSPLKNDYTVIKNCKIHGFNEFASHSAGILSFHSDNVLVEHNEIYDCAFGIKPKESNDDWIVRYNLIHDVGTAFNWNANPGVRNRHNVYQNVVYNAGIVFGGLYDLDYLNFYNNTLYNITGGDNYTFGWIPGSDYSAVTNWGMWNNILHTINSSQKVTAQWYQTPTISYWNYNWYYGWTCSDQKFGASGTQSFSAWQSNYDANGVCGTDPLFVDASGHDFHLQAGSTARSGGRGGSYSTVFGAYITGNETIGLSQTQSDTTPPASPVNLAVQ